MRIDRKQENRENNKKIIEFVKIVIDKKESRKG